MKRKITDYFRLIFFGNSILCLLTFIGMFVSSIIEIKHEQLQTELYNTLSTVFKLSAGAFIGLLGGRASKSG